MLSFFSRRHATREARLKIGVDLHRQIRNALMRDEAAATKGLESAFTVGYIYSFVRDGFSSLGVNAANELDLEIERICNGVMPVKLHQIYSDQRAAIMLARDMENQSKEILDLGISPAGVLSLFALGTKCGSRDAPLISLKATPPTGLERYLTGEKQS